MMRPPTKGARPVAQRAGTAGPPAPTPPPPPHWSASGAGWGLAAVLLATASALLTVRGPVHHDPARWTTPLRRLHSGHIGDYVACFLAGITLLAVLIV